VKKMISSDDAVVKVRQYVRSFPTLTDAAESLRVSKLFLSMVVDGHKPPYSVMERLGWERVVMYQRKTESEDEKP
jgi:hypothetical protein